MRVLVLSDLHANLEALEAVLEAAPRDRFDRLAVLGDLVGYGASPNEVVDRIFDLAPDVLIRGNHDKVAAGIEEPHHFHEVAAEAAHWTRDALTPANRDRVAALPQGPAALDTEIEVCHGTPFDEDVYIVDVQQAAEALAAASRPICLFGHTHVPVGFSLDQASGLDVIVPEPGGDTATTIPLDADRRYLINPGSVGQPRDGDPRAAYGVVDLTRREVVLHRVPYRADLAQERIVQAGLPAALARRLGVGR